MSLKISNASGTFDLQKDFNTEIEDSSPIYNERGSQSIAATIPGTKKNLRLNKHIERTDIDTAPAKDDRITISDGIYHRVGKMNVVSASEEEGITFNVGFSESELYSIWNAVSLQSLDMPVYKPEGGVSALVSYILDNRSKEDSPFCLFPIAVSYNRKVDKETIDYLEYLNNYNGSFGAARTETFFIDDGPVEVSLPEGYGVTPFLKVSYILETIFAAYGYTIIENPFTTHHQLKQLVVLNNAADCCVKGILKYSELMPDCTINEFMQALWCRFGLLYFVDGNTRSVRLKFIRDIINAPHSSDWTLLKASKPVINFEEPQQLKLSASTNVKGPTDESSAAPAAESLDKFLKPYNYIVTTKAGGYLVYKPQYAAYYKTDNVTQQTEFVSSEFFSWDRGADMAYKEISSVDEFLPSKLAMFKVSTTKIISVPLYLFSKVHRYTTITSSDVDISENLEYQTPLAFCFSFFDSNSYLVYGSQNCLDSQGKPALDKQYGEACDISLTFVGQYGLFSHFWRDYDAILRHANHVVETDVHLSAQQCMNPSFLSPILLDGQRMLPDSVRYTLPYRSSVPAKVKLRTIKLLKPFDLDKEQTVPIVEQLYTWKRFDNRSAAVNAATKSQVDEWRSKLGKDQTIYDLQYKNASTDAPNAKIPLSVPTEEDFNNKQEYFIYKATHSFDLYYRVRTYLGTSGGTMHYDISDPKGGVHYDVQYDQFVRAELF